MGEIIRIVSGTEREWERARAQWADGLSAIGALFGDDEGLMRAKADCVCQLLRRILEDVPPVRITAHLPHDLPAEHIELLTSAIREAALKGIEVSMTHCVRVLMAAVYDLCTSKLRQRPS